MSFKPIKVLDIELSAPLPEIEGLEGYGAVKALVRLHGVPLGYVQQPLRDGRCTAAALGRAIVEQQTWPILRHLVDDRLGADESHPALLVEAQVDAAHPAFAGPFPLVTVAVCTRERTEELARCLDGLVGLEYPALELLVVDNAPRTAATARLVQERYPQVRYVREPRPGLDWARNRAIAEARGEIVAYTDDDVLVDPGWVTALVRVFAAHPEVMAVTGLVAPFELETEAQLLFEQYGGFSRGFERRWYQLDPQRSWKDTMHVGTGAFGTGANMAYRRAVFAAIGGFDPALDVGTVTNGGGDLEMFFRVLKAGHTLVYEPAALVWHRHRRGYDQLRKQIANDGIAFVSVLVRCARAYPEERADLLRIALWWVRWWLLRRLLLSFLRPTTFRRDLIIAEIKGAVSGLTRYGRARRDADTIARSYGAPEKVLVSEGTSL